MTTNPSLREALITSSRAHAETDLNRFTQASHSGAVAIAAAAVLLTLLLLPRRTRFIATSLLTAAGVWVARNWLSQNAAPCLSGAARCGELENFELPNPELNDSLVDLQSHQSFPASDAPASP